MIPAIFGLSGPELTASERAFFAECDPAGFILFGRNCSDPAQLRALTDALRDLSGRVDLAILIDQEGGRVARLRSPHWPDFPAAWRFAELYDKAPISAIEAVRVNAEAIAATLFDVGINVNCAPTLDLRGEATHDVIGDRAFGSDPMQVAALGRATLQGLEAGGCLGVLKHMPGHGRAGVDSHNALPVTEADEEALESDIDPFRSLCDAPMGMVGHMLYAAWDRAQPASQSPVIIGDIIRKRIGFDGLLMSDDLAMGALSGTPAERAVSALAAGCDLALYCAGVTAENESVAKALPAIEEAAVERLAKAMARIEGIVPRRDYDVLAAKRDSLLGYA